MRMSAEKQLTLAEAAGTTLVAAMISDTWRSARSGIALLFTRHVPTMQADIEAQLDSNAALMKRSDPGERTRLLLEELWQLEFSKLLARSPTAAEDLAVWAISTEAGLPRASHVYRQTNIAHDDGVVNAVQHGNQYNHYMDSPDPRNSWPAGDSQAEDGEGA
jgi:hypothetical protein